MITNPRVSVIMTVYNGERHLAEAIDSIQRQSLKDFELVIVDDGSEDRTSEILAEAQRDHRIKVLSRPRLGRARALNTAWTHSMSRYVANLDADDLAEPTRLEKQLVFLERHPEVGLLGTACRVLDEKPGNVWILRHPLDNSELRSALVRHNPFVHSSVMMPRRALEEVGGYNESLRVAVDYDLWVRIACHYCVANLPDVLTVKRVHQQEYFRHRVRNWERARTRMRIRWHAWRNSSGDVTELPFVFLDPLARSLYLWATSLRTSSLQNSSLENSSLDDSRPDA